MCVRRGRGGGGANKIEKLLAKFNFFEILYPFQCIVLCMILGAWVIRSKIVSCASCSSSPVEVPLLPFTPRYFEFMGSNYIRFENMWFLNPDDVIEPAAFQFL